MAVVAQAASVYWRSWRKPLFTLVMVAVGSAVGETVGRWDGAALEVEARQGYGLKSGKERHELQLK